MQRTVDLAKRIEETCSLGVEKNKLSALILELDQRMLSIKKHLCNNQDEESNLTAEMQAAFEQKAMTVIELNQKIGTNERNDCVRVPYAINGLSNFIYNKVKNDLLLFATDFVFKGTLWFRISVFMFAQMTVCYDSPTKNEKFVSTKIQEMKNNGFVIEQRKIHWVLVDCDKNRELIQKYCAEELHGNTVQIESRKGVISQVLCRLKPYSIHLEPEKQELEKEVALDTLSEDDVFCVHRELRKFRAALEDLQKGEFKDLTNVLLLNCESNIYAIEDRLAIHGNIWRNTEARCNPVREKNKMFHAAIRDMDTESALLLSEEVEHEHRFDIAWRAIRDNAEALGERLGLYLSELCIEPHHIVSMTFIPDNVFCRVLPNGVDSFYDSRNERYCLCPTEKNISIILDIAKKQYPNVTLNGYSVKAASEGQYVSEIVLNIVNPTDLFCL